ncbi:hypothetical protein ACFE04_029615 [Oxalis oulophora]
MGCGCVCDCDCDCDCDCSKEELIRSLDDSNFDDTIRSNDFVVVTFYKPECSDYNKLIPQLEQAARVLNENNLDVVFAKVDADSLSLYPAYQYSAWKRYLTVKIFTGRGIRVDHYHGPLNAKGIIRCLKRLMSPLLTEINSSNDAHNLIGQQNTVIVGIFPQLSGEEYENFIKVAQILRFDYDFGVTLHIMHLPNCISSLVSSPLVRVFKPVSIYEDRAIDTNNFIVDHLLTFIKEEAVIPIITLFNHDPRLDAAFFSSKMGNDKVMLFIDRCCHGDYERTYCHLAKDKKEERISFMLGDFLDSQDAFEQQYFELHESKGPLVVIRNPKGQTYVNADLKNAYDIATWLEDYKAGKLEEHGTPSQKKNEPVMVVLPDAFEKMVIDSEKNVFLWLGPWCHWCDLCPNVAKVLDDVAVRFEHDSGVLIAKLYKNAYQIREEHLYYFIEDRPILCFKRAGEKKLYFYNGEISTYKIVAFIKKNTAKIKYAVDANNLNRDMKTLGLYGNSLKQKKTMNFFDTVHKIFEETTMANVLLVFFCPIWLSKHLEFTVLLDNVVAYFGKEKGNVLVDIALMDKEDTHCLSLPKTLVEVMHYFTTFSDDDEPTMFFKKAGGKIMAYDYEEISEENVKQFIEQHMSFIEQHVNQHF